MTIPSPCVQVTTDWLEKASVTMWVKRDDLIHPVISGNKWRKLQGYIQQYDILNAKGLLTWGSPWSNHLHAISYLALQGIPCHAIVPEDRHLESIPSLEMAVQNGLQLTVVDRSTFRDRWKRYDETIDSKSGFLIVPEGGSGPYAQVGLSAMCNEVFDQWHHPDYWLCAAGVGGMTVGILNAISDDQHVLSIECVKGARVASYITRHTQRENVTVLPGHQGGLGKWEPDMPAFLHQWQMDTGIALDPLYTGKMMYAFYKKVMNGEINSCSVMAIHSGGMIAWENWNYKKNNK